jgi:hypothetical protein
MTKKRSSSLPQTLLKVAWFSVLLGLGMELLLLAVAAGFKNSITAQTIVADLVQKISWSSFVCVGVAVGMAAGKMRAPMMGLAGLIAAPIAFNVSKVLHKSASQALSLAGPAAAAGGPSPFFIATLKGLEYAVLGVAVGILSKKSASLRMYVLAGTVVGLVFGGIIIYLTVAMSAKPLPLSGLVTRCVNEFIFPVGCSVVLFAAQKLGEKAK